MFFHSYGTHIRQVNHGTNSTRPLTNAGSSTCSSSSSSPSTSSSERTSSKKKVQFSQDVKDNELTSPRLIYDKLPMTSPPRKPPVVIDIAKLNADQGFGFNKYLPSDSNSSDDYHQQIFESPYFDYRRTHSRVNYHHFDICILFLKAFLFAAWKRLWRFRPDGLKKRQVYP